MQLSYILAEFLENIISQIMWLLCVRHFLNYSYILSSGLYCSKIVWLTLMDQLEMPIYHRYQLNYVWDRYKLSLNFYYSILKNILPAIELLNFPRGKCPYNHVCLINLAFAKLVQLSNYMPLHLWCSCSPTHLPNCKTLPFNFCVHNHTHTHTVHANIHIQSYLGQLYVQCAAVGNGKETS